MHDPEKSDSGRVAAKPTNKAGRPAAEPVEPRPGTKGNADQQSTHRTQSRVRVTQALDRVRQAARQRKPDSALTSNTRGRSRMPKSGPSGSVRGAPSNGRPYRDVRRETGKEFVVQDPMGVWIATGALWRWCWRLRLRRSEQRVLPGLYRLDLFQKQFEPIEFPADLSLQMIRQRAAIARLQLVEPLVAIAAQRLVVGYALAEQQSLDAVDVFDSLADQRLALAAQAAAILFFGRWRLDHCAHPGLAPPIGQQ